MGSSCWNLLRCFGITWSMQLRRSYWRASPRGSLFTWLLFQSLKTDGTKTFHIAGRRLFCQTLRRGNARGRAHFSAWIITYAGNDLLSDTSDSEWSSPARRAPLGRTAEGGRPHMTHSTSASFPVFTS